MTHVVNIDDHVHRIGCPGCAGSTGAVVSLVNEQNSGVMRDLRELRRGCSSLFFSSHRCRLGWGWINNTASNKGGLVLV